MVIVATTGDAAAVASPRLTYLSKAYASLAPAASSLNVVLAVPGLFTRFCLLLPTRHVVLGADRYAPDAAETCGSMTYGSTLPGFEARGLSFAHDFSVPASDRRVVAYSTSGTVVTLDLAAGLADDRIYFRATQLPIAVTVGAASVAPAAASAGMYSITLGTTAASTVKLEFATTSEPDAGPVDSRPRPPPPDTAGPTPDAGAPDAAMELDSAPAPDTGTESDLAMATPDAMDAVATPDAAAPADALPADAKLDGGGAAAVLGTDDGCGCRVGSAPSPQGSSSAISLALAGLLAVMVSRRRRR